MAGDDIGLTRAAGFYRTLISGEAQGPWPAVLRGGLCVASVPYGWATLLRNRLYDRGWRGGHRAPVPVVSVGNLTLGGTGKTPCVEYVAGFYRQWGRKVAVLSRGYGRTDGPNDEALVLRENLPDVPHLQGADRVSLAAEAVRRWHSDVLVLDDGFQHRRLARDLDLVLIDATQPWGYDSLFPRGLLREAREGLRRAGLVILTRCDQVSDVARGRLKEAVSRIAPSVPVAEAAHRPRELANHCRMAAPLEAWRGRPVSAFCGIGNPAAFRATLTGLGFHVAAFRAFPDHHPYPPTDVADLDAWVRGQAGDAVVSTQKDLVKLRRPRLGGKELWALRVCFHVEAGEDILVCKLQEVLEHSR